MNKIFNITKFFFNYKNLIIIIDKILKRLINSNYNKIKIINNNLDDIEKFMFKENKHLFNESKNYHNNLMKISKEKLKEIPYNLGGGGACNLIYFLVRKRKPKVAVESGVAAGFSTHAILSAIKKNKCGTLFSSDFPYFRIPNSEKYIGILIDSQLKDNWKLFINGDKFNLKLIKKEINKIDFIHYDSDKSYSGRKYFFDELRDNIDENTIILMDDIQDNSFFFDYLKNYYSKKYKVFKFENKFVGLIY